ncbi:MAG: formylglycine-generating enzyme family protein [Planctomycetaceae bacterium]|nr:formylglycine-generating enzyme family protein [Planctomycetaceae bacterium]
MKNVACVLIIAGIAVFAGISTATAQEDNPIFTSSLEFIKNPVPCENSTAATAGEMKAYEDTIPAPAPYGDRKFKMIPIPGGKFKMGSPASEKGHNEIETPQFEVEVQPFWMGEAEVTWREFELYGLKYMKLAHEKDKVDNDRFSIADALAWPTPPYNIGAISFNKSSSTENFPASGMTHYAAQVYCKWLTSITGRYYRLPTEAEWEFACRAETTTAFSFGDDPAPIDDYAWTTNNCEVGTGYHAVKQKKPNAYGLYDMHGNVAEWTCQQFKKGDYQEFADGKIPNAFIPASQKEKFGVRAAEKFGQVARGGSCDHDPEDCRSATRLVADKEWKKQDPMFPQSIWWITDAAYVGFRVIRPLTPPATDEEAALYDPAPEIWVKYKELNQRD